MTGHPERDWPEAKSPHRPGSNDNYANICSQCRKAFAGNKRRVVCRACAVPETAAERAGLREMNAELLEVLVELEEWCSRLGISEDSSETMDRLLVQVLSKTRAVIAKAEESAA